MVGVWGYVRTHAGQDVDGNRTHCHLLQRHNVMRDLEGLPAEACLD
jgi:hypothetical protein